MGEPFMSNKVFDCLFEPLIMPNLELKNRFFMAPVGTGFAIEELIPFLTARARGGAAMITTGETSIHPGGRGGMKNETLLECDDDIAPLAKLAKAVKIDGAKIVLQLNHCGRYSFGSRVGGQAVAPSAVMSGFTGEMPHELSTVEADDLVIAFAHAALRARIAGFDGVEFMGSSGYLIAEFLSPLTNKRTDKYGGDAVGRANFIISILKEARKLVGSDFNLCVKFDADDGMKDGVTLKESRQFAPALVQAGADRLHVWAGWHESPRPMLPMTVPAGAFVYLAEEIKKTVPVPVSTVGRINYPEIAAEIIAKGKADLIGLARGLIADPDFVNKTRDGRVKEIRRCTACCHCFDCILSGMKTGGDAEFYCSINPEVGREGESLIKRADKPRHVAVVGAGPAGLEASRVASMRGHKVTIYEKDSQIGGMVNLSLVPPYKYELKNITDYYSYQLKINNIDVRLSTEFIIDEMIKIKPDVIVLATGAKIVKANIQGASGNNVFTAIEVLQGKSLPGKSVVVIGGGMVGLETAEYLSDKEKEVTVVEMDRIASDIGSTTRWEFISRIRRKMKILSSTRVLEIRGKGVLVLEKNNIEKEIQADTVVLAAGMGSIRDLANSDAIKGIEYYLVGSCKEPGRIDEAIKDGFNVGCII
jgi:2,4-dienoyl-CoA reductase-like NADH-dependent reductase (Old Yellow Enzyme family)/thioredoxin reductase